MFIASRSAKKRNQRLHELVTQSGQHAFQLALQYVNDTDTAKDIVQRSLLKAMETPHLPDEDLKYWFFRIVRNTALDQLRHNTRKRHLSDQVKNHVETTRNTVSDIELYERVQEQKTQQSIIENCLVRLSPEHREIIILKDLQDYSYDQISKILGIAKGTVMSRLHRARLALKNEVLKHETS